MSRVSVVMSTYGRNRPEGDCPNLLRRAVDSVLGQTFGDFELVLMDDASTDGTEEVCREYAARDSRVKLFRAKRNSGCPAKRYNDGMRLAKSDLFMFMFDDDLLYPDAVRFLLEAMDGEHKDCGMVYGLTNYVEVERNFQLLVGGEWNLHDLKKDNDFCLFLNLSVIVKRGVIDAVGGYDESPLFRRTNDWDLWVRIGDRYKVARVTRLVGKVFQGYGDSIGKTVAVTDEDRRLMAEVQAMPGRKVRLMGEMGLPTADVEGGYA